MFKEIDQCFNRFFGKCDGVILIYDTGNSIELIFVIIINFLNQIFVNYSSGVQEQIPDCINSAYDVNQKFYFWVIVVKVSFLFSWWYLHAACLRVIGCYDLIVVEMCL